MTPVSIYKLASDIDKEALLVMEVPPQDIFTQVSTLCTMRLNQISLDLPEKGPAFVFYEKINSALEDVSLEIQQYLDDKYTSNFVLEMSFEPPDVIHCSIRLNRTRFPNVLNTSIH